MKIIPPRFELGRDEVRKPVITIGNFDGLHRGHRELIRKVIARARKIGGQGALITFIPHPIRVLHPDANLEILTTLEQKIVLLEDQGIDLLILLEFTPEFSRMSAEKFVREYLVGTLGVAEIYAGEDFSFGHGHEGNLRLLLSLAGELQFKVHVVSKTPSGTHPISSSRIRSLVKKGKVSESAEMLGRLYTIEGRVAKGAGRGKNLGYPTVNLEEVRNLLPAPGIYITETQVRGKTLPSVSYLGPRLTFGESSPAIESHILDYHEEVYGDWVRLAFISKIRGTMKFRSPEELKEAIAKDVARARRYFERSGSLPKDGKTGS